MSMNFVLGSRLAMLTFLAICGGLACSAKTVDLGNNSSTSTGPIYSEGPPPAVASGVTDAGAVPFFIVDREQSKCALQPYSGIVGLFTVDSGRLFWFSQTPTSGNGKYSLRSCDIEHCASSILSSNGYDIQYFDGTDIG